MAELRGLIAGHEVEEAVTSGLPIAARVGQVWLLVSDGQRWNRWETFPLRG